MSSNTFNSIILIHPLNLLKLKVPVIGTGDNEILRLPDGNLLSSRQEWSRGRIAQVGGEGSGPRMQVSTGTLGSSWPISCRSRFVPRSGLSLSPPTILLAFYSEKKRSHLFIHINKFVNLSKTSLISYFFLNLNLVAVFKGL